MQTPSSSRKRRRPQKVDDDEERAEVTRNMAPGIRRITRSEKRFKKKVLSVVQGDIQVGHYRTLKNLTLAQTSIGEPRIQGHDDYTAGAIQAGNDSRLEFFTPGAFKDAQEILWGTKPVTILGPNTRTGEILNMDIPIVIKRSQVKLLFKNNSQRVTRVEMFICRAKEIANQFIYEQFLQNNDAYISYPTALGGRNIQTATQKYTSTMWSIYDNPNILQDYHVEKVSMRFDPGEKYSHTIKGPFGDHELNLVSKLASNGTLASPVFETSLYKGSGVQVVFRVLNEPAIVVGTSGVVGNTNNNSGLFSTIIEPPHANATTGVTGVQCRIIQDIVLAAPNGQQVSSVTIPERPVFYMHSFLPANPTGTLTYTDVDHAAPQSLGISDK